MTAPDIREAEECARRIVRRHSQANFGGEDVCWRCHVPWPCPCGATAQDYLDLVAFVREVLVPALEQGKHFHPEHAPDGYSCSLCTALSQARERGL